jgi:hypothetical protein
MKLGTPKYEQSKRNYFSFKKNQNTFILRVLPPLGDLAETGKWSIYHRVEFGYTGSDGKMKPFLSPRVVNYGGMVEVESEAHKRREMIKEQQSQAKRAGNSVVVEQCTKMLQKYNQDAKHHMNVIDLQGNIGLFKIGHKGFQALKAEVDRLRSEGVDPIGVENGRFFVFSRNGSGRDTLYTVTEYKQKQEISTPSGKMVAMVDFPHAITQSILSKLETDAFELDKIYPTVTPEEERRIVHEGAAAVDVILGSRKPKADVSTATKQTARSGLSVTPQTDSLNKSQPTATMTTTTNPVVTATAVAEEDFYGDEEESANLAGGLDLSGMSEEEFFKKVSSGNF